MGMETKILLKIYGEAVSWCLLMRHVQNEPKILCAGSLGSRNNSILGSLRGGEGVRDRGLDPCKIRQLYGSLAILVTPGYHKTSKPAFLMFGHHWSTSKSPFKWRFTGDLNGVSLEGQI